MNELTRLLFFIFLFKLNSGFCQNRTFFKNIVEYLSSDELSGRQIGTKGILISEKYIVEEYKKIGVKPFDSFNNSYVQEFTISDSIPVYKGIRCENIIGIIDNKADSALVFCAHYDHIGNDPSLSKEVLGSQKKLIHNGADDNASGVAMVLALAKYLSGNNKRVEYNYIFVNCSAHEIGLFGSDFFYNSSFFKELKVKAFINIDMIGRLNAETKCLKIGGLENNGIIKNFFIEKNLVSNELNFLFNDEQLLMSDATIFFENKIPTYSFTTGINDDYHRSTDDADKIDYKGMKSILLLLENFIVIISKKSD